MPNPKAPHYRGHFKSFGPNGLFTELDRASLRFLPVRSGQNRMTWLSVVSVYGAKETTNVYLSTRTGKTRYRRLFMSSRFPFFSLSPTLKNAYKSLHFGFGRRVFSDPCTIDIATQHQASLVTTPALELAPVAPGLQTMTLNSLLEKTIQASDPAALKDMSHSDIAPLIVACQDFRDQDPQDTNLLKAQVFLDVLRLTNHKRAFKALETLASQIDEAEFKRFSDMLADLNTPLALGRHGYYPSFAKLDLHKTEAELVTLFETTARLGAPGFINSGTLLGYIRDGCPIIHDDDFDIAVMIEGDSFSQIAANWKTFKKGLSQTYTVVDKGSFVAIQLQSGVQVDVFPAWTLSDRFYVYPYCYGDVSSAAVTPLRSHSARGHDLPTPQDPEALLAINYSENWRKPDPFWRFDWSRAKKRFRNELRALKGT